MVHRAFDKRKINKIKKSMKLFEMAGDGRIVAFGTVYNIVYSQIINEVIAKQKSGTGMVEKK